RARPRARPCWGRSAPFPDPIGGRVARPWYTPWVWRAIDMRVVRRGLGWALGLTLAVVTAAHAQSGEPPADSGGGPIPPRRRAGEPPAEGGGGPTPPAEVGARAAEIRSLLETQDVAITPSREVQTI